MLQRALELWVVKGCAKVGDRLTHGVVQEHRAPANPEIRHAVDATLPVDHAPFGVLRHAGRAHVVPAAFETTAKIQKGKGDGDPVERQVRIACRDQFRKSNLLERIIPDIELMLAASGLEVPKDAPEAVEPAIPKEETSGDDGHRG